MDGPEYDSYDFFLEGDEERYSAKESLSNEVMVALAALVKRQTMRGGEWLDDSLCSVPGVDPEIFDEANGKIEEAKKYCAVCTVREQCLQYATESHQDYLIWGGKTAKERRPKPPRKSLIDRHTK